MLNNQVHKLALKYMKNPLPNKLSITENEYHYKPTSDSTNTTSYNSSNVAFCITVY
jgi:hypothetical protein